MGSFLCADLQHAGASIGLLAAGFNERTGPFSPRELRLFRSIAQQAAVALENARLVESLRGASRLKSEFIGTMSHELRSPLNVVIGYVDLLLDEDMGAISAEQREALERVRQHALQLLELIQEALDINRLDAGLLPLDLETFTVHEFLEDVKDSIPAEWAKPNVDLVWQVEPAPLLLRSDRGKLKKVLRNLVHNALKFTDQGSVTVKVTTANGWIDFTVSDTGIGMSPEALPFIFDMFRQVDGSTTRRYGGVGLGLYIVKQLVRGARRRHQRHQRPRRRLHLPRPPAPRGVIRLRITNVTLRNSSTELRNRNPHSAILTGAAPQPARPVSSGRPSMQFMFWMAEPAAPLPRLSSAEKTTTLPRRSSTSAPICTKFDPATEATLGYGKYCQLTFGSFSTSSTRTKYSPR